MAAPGAFIIKERLEGLESRINMALDEAGLKDFSKQVARAAIDEAVDEVVTELQTKGSSILDDLKVERANVDMTMSEHVERIEESLVRVDRIAKLSLALSVISIAVLFLL